MVCLQLGQAFSEFSMTSLDVFDLQTGQTIFSILFFFFFVAIHITNIGATIGMNINTIPKNTIRLAIISSSGSLKHGPVISSLLE